MVQHCATEMGGYGPELCTSSTTYLDLYTILDMLRIHGYLSVELPQASVSPVSSGLNHSPSKLPNISLAPFFASSLLLP
mgnify:CR=1 FL=1